ncbi:hypothetical protein LCGC14_1700800 [marine sediment metagenome]|uniref:Uncharacterized protein n=1 Tax=marine sediment metagenome TaxID=412755 RepID=A0A0F9JYF8_9ZZZZ
MVSGLYINKYNPEHNRNDTTAFQKVIKGRVSRILNVFKRLKIAKRYGQNTVKIDREKLKEFSLKYILSQTLILKN